MPIELTVLALAALLGIAQLVLLAIAANLQLSSKYLAGPRDEGLPLEGRAARLERAYRNHLEGLAFFTVAVVVIVLTGKDSELTRNCALVYLAARVVYLPAYFFGWAPWRSVIWGFGFLATVTMLVAGLR